MARIHTQFIDETECIGDSLDSINNSFQNLDTSVQDLSSVNNTQTSGIGTLNTNLVSLSSQVYTAPTSTASGTVLRAYIHTFSNESKRAGNLQNYIVAPGSTLTVVSTRPNSRFIITVSGIGYTLSSVGANLGISRTISTTTTRVLGIDGANGDTWMGASNGYNGSFNITRSALDSPNQPTGTTISYAMLHGHWSAGTSWINYKEGVYTTFSSVTVYEIV